MLDRVGADRPVRSADRHSAPSGGPIPFSPDRRLALQDRFRTDFPTSAIALRNCESLLHRRAVLFVLSALAAICAGALTAFLLDRVWEARRGELSNSEVQLVVEGIIRAESGGNSRAVNPRSTATGAGQFIESTWLDLAKKHLPDLNGRSDAEILQLRYDPDLSRAMTGHLVRRNATVLRKRGLAVTPGNLYLAHFAGGAGAAAILLAPHDADAALTMARADASGRTSRETLVAANPFLEGMTTRDLRMWADRKLHRVSVAGRP